jgi:hypothetical protein
MFAPAASKVSKLPSVNAVDPFHVVGLRLVAYRSDELGNGSSGHDDSLFIVESQSRTRDR